MCQRMFIWFIQTLAASSMDEGVQVHLQNIIEYHTKFVHFLRTETWCAHCRGDSHVLSLQLYHLLPLLSHTTSWSFLPEPLDQLLAGCQLWSCSEGRQMSAWLWCHWTQPFAVKRHAIYTCWTELSRSQTDCCSTTLERDEMQIWQFCYEAEKVKLTLHFSVSTFRKMALGYLEASCSNTGAMFWQGLHLQQSWHYLNSCHCYILHSLLKAAILPSSYPCRKLLDQLSSHQDWLNLSVWGHLSWQFGKEHCFSFCKNTENKEL